MLPTRKAEALLAVLALADGAICPRERLTALLWGDRGEAQARHSLSQALSSIRTALGNDDCLIATREGVAVGSATLVVDVIRFRSLAEADGFDALDEAARLYRGPLLDGTALREDAFAEWLSVERTRLHDLAVGALLRLARAARLREDPTSARFALERAVLLEPLSEEAHRDLIRLHLDEGRPAEAARQYAACADMLHRELQVEPGPELAALRREALGRTSVPPPVVAEAAGDERKLITALAASLLPGPSAPVDPEDLEPLLEAAARRVSAAVRANGGHLLRASSEGVLAAFGAPLALEDHGLRACHAALAVLAVAEGSDGAVTFGVGLDSAEALLRGGALSGPPLQRAVRLAAAAPGAVVATEATVALTRGRMRFAPTGSPPADAAQPGAALYRLEGPASAPPAPTASPAGFVERRVELDALAAALVPAEKGSGRLVAVVGEAGVGKSRLVREFLAGALPSHWRAIAYGADSQSTEIAHAAVAGLMRAYFGLAEEDEAKIVRARVTAVAQVLGLTPAVTEALLALLGGAAAEANSAWAVLEPAQRRRRLVDAVKALLHRHAADQPLLVVLEDLHWLDAASREILESLVESLPASRLALLVNCRPEFVHGWTSLAHYRPIRLEPLSAAGAQALLDRALGPHESLDPLKRRLAARAGGNPFFLEECARAAEAAGLLRGEPGAYRLAGDPDALVLPATVQAVIAARLDRLAPEDKRLLQVAAVIGAEPSGPLLRAVSGLADDAFERAIVRLQAGEFLLPLRIVPETAYRFKHALTHDVVYGSLLRQDRRELHLRVLRTLERIQGGAAPQRTSEAPVELLALHAARAEEWQAAATYGRRAGLRAAARSANREAVGHYDRALDALRRLPEGAGRAAAEVDLHLEIRNALFVVGEPAAIPAHLEEAARIAEATGDTPRQVRAGLLLSGWYWQNGQHRLAAEAADRAVAIAAADGDDLTAALGLYRRGTNLQAVGVYAAAAATLREALALLERRGAQDAFDFGGHPFVFCCSFLSWSLAELGENEAARREGQRGWEAAARLGNSYSQAVMSFGYGHALIRAGALEEAEEVLSRGLELYRVAEVPATYPWIAAGLGYVRVLRGDAEQGLALLRHAVEPEVRRRGPMYAHTYLRLAEAARQIGLADEALAAAHAGRAAAAAQEERGHLAWAERVFGDLLSSELPREARMHYRTAAEIAKELGMSPEFELAGAGLERLRARGSRRG
ncbi:AAA family ATPase [Roseomonas sp. HF4]|uniref:AAA family ATPase n=1 Tax=Roseomonas sp. HF4 TaxID=2562313 RepID=UPI0014854810|nr:AAA family ATPase [Roseomonas sp. HF4]